MSNQGCDDVQVTSLSPGEIMERQPMRKLKYEAPASWSVIGGGRSFMSSFTKVRRHPIRG